MRVPDSSVGPKLHALESFKALLKVVVAAERALDGPEDLAHGTTV
jgi:hypothetical protein